MVENIPLDVRQGITRVLNLQSPDALHEFSHSGGGCINPGGKLTTAKGSFFLKWNSAGKFPSMFESEAKGLALLRKSGSIAIPQVVDVNERGEHQFLLLEFIEQGPRSESYWKDLGSGLANVHKVTNGSFGLDHDNYIGSLRQLNAGKESWTDFFINRRLNVQLKLAMDSGLAGRQLTKSFESLYRKLDTLIPVERPSLLHGDLWSGNIITTRNGHPCLIDPAVYYGCREVDLAMTKLFGSFPGEFYDSYIRTFPLLPGYDDRFELYNLYPLLVHLNLFGVQYMSPITGIISRFV